MKRAFVFVVSTAFAEILRRENVESTECFCDFFSVVSRRRVLNLFIFVFHSLFDFSAVFMRFSFINHSSAAHTRWRQIFDSMPLEPIASSGIAINAHANYFNGCAQTHSEIRSCDGIATAARQHVMNRSLLFCSFFFTSLTAQFLFVVKFATVHVRLRATC